MPVNPKYLATFEASGYYHVFNRSHSDKKLFREEKNYEYFLDLIGRFLLPYLEFYSYCLLPNHFHFLVRIKEENHSDSLDKKISNQFRSFFIAYTNAFNKLYNMHGGLFATPFRRTLIDSDEYLSRVICYIHGNPFHHNICKTPDKYRHSSYLSIINNVESIVNRDRVLEWFGSLDEFIKIHNARIASSDDVDFFI